jgi:hypothetical protein
VLIRVGTTIIVGTEVSVVIGLSRTLEGTGVGVLVKIGTGEVRLGNGLAGIGVSDWQPAPKRITTVNINSNISLLRIGNESPLVSKFFLNLLIIKYENINRCNYIKYV